MHLKIIKQLTLIISLLFAITIFAADTSNTLKVIYKEMDEICSKIGLKPKDVENISFTLDMSNVKDYIHGTPSIASTAGIVFTQPEALKIGYLGLDQCGYDIVPKDRTKTGVDITINGKPYNLKWAAFNGPMAICTICTFPRTTPCPPCPACNYLDGALQITSQNPTKSDICIIKLQHAS